MVKHKNEIDEKLIYLFNKISQIIRYIQWEINKETKLSPLMLQILEYLSNNSRELRTPHKIAEDLGVKRPTVTDSLKVLVKRGYVKEKLSEEDRRYKILSLTKKGEDLLKREELNLKEILKDSVDSLSNKEKENLFISLIKFISDLNHRGLLPVVRVCLNCENFEKNKFNDPDKPHYCRFLNIRMGDYDLSVNCEKNTFVNK